MDKIVKISGGLGNQLFQYSFGRYLELNFGFKVIYDLRTIQNGSTFTNRLTLINDLIKNINYNDNKFYKNELIYRLRRKLIHDYFPDYSKIYVENVLKEKVLKIEELSKKKYFDGYWQTLKYVNSIENELRSDLNFNESLVNLCLIDYNIISNSNSCSLHIRRGDYLLPHNKKIFAECGIDYIQKSINYIMLKFPDTKFYVFSDDINWAKSILKGDNYHFIDKYNNNPIADLFLMSTCKNNIISNSTFSWWGSWLNNNTNKMIICPKLWYNNSTLNKIHIKNITNDSYTLI
jgi:hypothetical protein